MQAYLEFQGTLDKLSRCTATVHSLTSLLSWWNGLLQHDRFLRENIDKLISTGEEILKAEIQSWRSTSEKVKLLQKQLDKNNS